MSNTLAAARYARAIWDLAQKKGAETQVLEDMDSITQTLADSPDLHTVLQDPTVQAAKKKAILLQIFKDSHSITQGLVEALAANGRLDIVGEVAHAFRNLYDSGQKQEQAMVYSAEALSETTLASIKKKLEEKSDKEILIKNEIKPELLGGFVIRWGDMQYDASVAQRLSSLKKRIYK